MQKMKKRLPEIDALRGIAVLGMIIFHFFFDLDYFDILRNQMFSGWWLIFARFGQFLFLGLVGFSVALSSRSFSVQCLRAGKIFAAGMLVTFVTWIFAPDAFVKFGVLHFIGVAIPIAWIFKAGIKKNLLVGGSVTLLAAFASFFAGRYFLSLFSTSDFLFPLGIISPGFSSLDYFPIFPWIAVVLTGLVLGELYLKNVRKNFEEVFLLSWMGRHSLIIYLVHQPVLILLIISASAGNIPAIFF